MPREWCGKSLLDLKVREKYRLNVIGIKDGDTVNVTPDPKMILRAGTIVIVVGENKDLEVFRN